MALPPGTPIAAKFAFVSFGYLPNAAIVNADQFGVASNLAPQQVGTHLYRSTWEVTPQTDPADTSNFEGEGFTDRIGTLKDVEVTITGFFDVGQNDYDNPPLIVPGNDNSNLALFLRETDGPYWYFPKFLVVSHPLVANVRDALRLTGLRIQNRGVFYFPSGQPSGVP